jgi:succinate-semialdehyde dehydrogenase/glutarate-semialdehyde dehydrogenase
MSIATIDPSTGKIEQTFKPLTNPEIEKKLSLAAHTSRTFRKTSFAERAVWMSRAADLLVEKKEEYGRLMTREMGKLLRDGVAEAEKCATACRYYAGQAESLLKVRPVKTEAAESYVRFDPLGPVLAIMPWNFPFWQVFRFAAPALMAGNVGLLKHASNVPQCALAIERIFLEAGFPEGAFQALLLDTPQVEAVLEDPRVAAVTLTGSETAGASVAARAGKLLKKAVLELGGSDPFVVLPSADMKEAVATAVKARHVNGGQSCIAAKRFIVTQPIAAEFEKLFVQAIQALKVGDPLAPETEVGPLAGEDFCRRLDAQVQKAVRDGARVLAGGKRLEGKGSFFQPTVLTGISPSSPAYREEFFGPVACLYVAKDLDDAIRLANDTSFGLGASAWTQDVQEKERLVRDLEAGLVFINGMVVSDTRLPFGGVKRSGYGRELGEYGILEFVNVKTVVVR